MQKKPKNAKKCKKNLFFGGGVPGQEGGVPGPGGCTWSWGVYAPEGVYLSMH